MSLKYKKNFKKTKKEVLWIPIPLDEISYLPKNSKIKYRKRDSDDFITCYVQFHWENDERVKGLYLGFRPYEKNKENRFPILNGEIDEIYKEVDPSIYFEYRLLLNMIKSN